MDLIEHILVHSAFSPYLFPLLLLVIANTVAWAAALVFGAVLAAPLDFGITLRDGSRLLGDHKTWRGLISAAVACGAITQSLHLGLWRGAAFGTLALLGDAAASFVKRRLRLAPGTEVPGLDQLPEALVPLLLLQQPLGFGLRECFVVAVIFTVLDVAVTKLRHLR